MRTTMLLVLVAVFAGVGTVSGQTVQMYDDAVVETNGLAGDFRYQPLPAKPRLQQSAAPPGRQTNTYGPAPGRYVNQAAPRAPQQYSAYGGQYSAQATHSPPQPQYRHAAPQPARPYGQAQQQGRPVHYRQASAPNQPASQFPQQAVSPMYDENYCGPTNHMGIPKAQYPTYTRQQLEQRARQRQRGRSLAGALYNGATQAGSYLRSYLPAPMRSRPPQYAPSAADGNVTSVYVPGF